VSVRLRGTS